MADKFRRKKEPKHIRLYASITGSEAWRHLSGNAVKVLLALVARDDGTRNGTISFSVREASETANISVPTATRCLHELVELGFIRCTEKGAFSRKLSHASTWRYTWAAWPGGAPAAPTRDFEKWRSDEKTRCKNFRGTVQNSLTPDRETPATVKEICTADHAKPQKPVRPQIKETCTHTINQGDRGKALPAISPNDIPPTPGGPFAASDGQVEMWAMPAPAQPPCEQCGAVIASLSKNGLKRFCGEPCRKKAERVRARQRRREGAMSGHGNG